ncbi:hypothetical protein UCRPC4_g01968 [Phaeomoniella chlamydospora]|uniref:F-box domain-containing protein n=1 Tax=Phaeomoniella chlamydospora TaxID=158046 RepID=A0A0G2EQU5_PHACM|nr:hypothetical protein UCRPC4_g01968 [Phaeomoniella chlamydospora]
MEQASGVLDLVDSKNDIRIRRSWSSVSSVPSDQFESTCLANLPTLDAEVGNLADRNFILDNGRIASARVAQHISSGPIVTAPRKANIHWRFAHYTADNILRNLQEEEQTDRETIKPRKRQRRGSKAKEAITLITRKQRTERRLWTFPLEVWFRIFEYAGVQAMVNAEQVHPGLKYALRENEMLWKYCRIQEYGDKAPGPPPGMSEADFGHLIAGRGCQSPSCHREHSSKVYWAFRSRLCSECFQMKTIKASELSGAFQTQPKCLLLDYVQAGILHAGKYMNCRRAFEDLRGWTIDGQWKLVFLKEDVSRIEAEYESGIAAGLSSDHILAGFASRRTEVLEFALCLTKIELWETQIKAPKRHRSERERFFQEQAAKLNPPIPLHTLKHMLPFHRSLDSNRPPTMEQFDILKTKILPLRDEAERIVDVDRLTDSISWLAMMSDSRHPDMEAERKLKERRDGNRSPEQKDVQDLTTQVFEELTDKVADSDLVLMVLKQVKRRWWPLRVRGMCFDGVMGPYELSMDDARLAVKTIKELTSNYDAQRTDDLLEKFRCPACYRTDKVKRYDFVSLFGHLHAKHTRFASDFSRLRKPFHRFGENFPWYTVPWPENLPVLADHQQPNSSANSLVWDFDTAKDYEQRPTTTAVSAFSDRVVNIPLNIAPSDFFPVLLYAGKKLFPTALPRDVQTALALRFALDCYKQNKELNYPPPVDTLISASEQLTKASSASLEDEHKLEFRFPCGACTNDRTVHRSSQWVRGPRSFRDLLNHFIKFHQDIDPSLGWIDNLFAVPSDTKVFDLLTKADASLEKRKREEAVKQQKRRKDAKKKISEKADIVLKTPMAWDVFKELWRKNEELSYP